MLMNIHPVSKISIVVKLIVSIFNLFSTIIIIVEPSIKDTPDNEPLEMTNFIMVPK